MGKEDGKFITKGTKHKFLEIIVFVFCLVCVNETCIKSPGRILQYKVKMGLI